MTIEEKISHLQEAAMEEARAEGNRIMKQHETVLENIFEPNTPLHDGALIIRGTRIVAAGCFLQLTEENSISKQLGTRHRAAIGVTEQTDATSLIVSEETGIMSMARSGKLTRHMDAQSLRTVLHEIYDPEKDTVTGVITPMINRWRGKK